MCGINGIVSRKHSENLEKRIESMNNSLIHRGPDHGGVSIISSNVALGHRRLSILDLDSRSNQPMQSKSCRYTITYNGEIFNFEQIKGELSYSFETESDTEVIVVALELKGLDWFLSRANGMFAIAIFDTELDEITLIRDRFGIKPLYYYQDKDLIVFSSEIKGILASGLVEAEFQEEAIDEYLANRYVREPFTFFRNISQLEAAKYLKFDSSFEKKETTYWSLPRMNFDKTYDENAIIKRTKSEVESAIRRWLIADVKVGSYLSGGVDSSLTTAIMSIERDEPVHTYTIGFDEEGFNEFKYSRIVSEMYNTIHNEIVVDRSDYFDEWERLIKYKDAPLGVPNEVPLALMSTQLSKDITVVISGEGADELFGGYGKIFRLAFDLESNSNTDFYTEFMAKYEYVSREVRDEYLVTSNFRDYFDKKVQREFDAYDNRENIFRYFHTYHLKGLLQRVDYTTMQTSIEARPPFLDHELVEFAFTKIPYELKLKWLDSDSKLTAVSSSADEYSEHLDIPKYVLKQVANYYLPSEIVDRKKVGFPVPLTNWFPNLESLCNKYLSDAKWVDTKKINDLIAKLRIDNRAGQLLWMFINVELFYRQYFNKKWKW